MPVGYCHKHDSHREIDWHVYCAECEDEVEALRNCIIDQKKMIEATVCASNDPKYFYDGKQADNLKHLDELETKLEVAEMILNQC